mmetsp:Transcript_11642/g.33523  ORF Transcript_11642/g.33523 Transcript_11642/m.33523 type:complete len:336 (+) Transcript_11642:5458-6465(+)
MHELEALAFALSWKLDLHGKGEALLIEGGIRAADFVLGVGAHVDGRAFIDGSIAVVEFDELDTGVDQRARDAIDLEQVRATALRFHRQGLARILRREGEIAPARILGARMRPNAPRAHGQFGARIGMLAEEFAVRRHWQFHLLLHPDPLFGFGVQRLLLQVFRASAEGCSFQEAGGDCHLASWASRVDVSVVRRQHVLLRGRILQRRQGDAASHEVDTVDVGAIDAQLACHRSGGHRPILVVEAARDRGKVLAIAVSGHDGQRASAKAILHELDVGVRHFDGNGTVDCRRTGAFVHLLRVGCRCDVGQQGQEASSEDDDGFDGHHLVLAELCACV